MPTVRTRIAPSPTGFMHIGTLRTALFNYFLSRQQGGEFLIRIEDTDQKRLVEGAVESLLQTLTTVGITHDEGPILLADGTLGEKGEVGPYVQSARLPLYREHVQTLLDKKVAYPCFCTSDRLEVMRKKQEATKQTPKYDRLCLKLSAEEISSRIAAGEKHVIRMLVPEGETAVNDLIRGKIVFAHKDVDDQVLMKTDGFPTYHLAVVVDDHLMKITHVLRGEEWLPSTPKHVLLFQMFGWEAPQFAHLPLLLNPDKKKLSKRQGDVAVEDFLKKGYLPEALINFVGTLGFNPTADREVYAVEELIAAFDLSRVNKGGAVLNMDKLNWMNRHYMMALSEEAFMKALMPFVPTVATSEVLRRAALIERPRLNRLDQFAETLKAYEELPTYSGEILVWKKSNAEEAKAMLGFAREVVAGLTYSSIAGVEEAVKAAITAKGYQNGVVLWPLRVALSGAEKSASPFEYLYALGTDEALSRIDIAIGKM